MAWQVLPPLEFPNDQTKPYGFVVDHSTYWGVPISGKYHVPPPGQAGLDSIQAPPSKLQVSNPDIDVSVGDDGAWTGGNFSVLATCTPPLFHAFHHKTDEFIAGQGEHGGGHGARHGAPQGEHFDFEPRAETNLLEREFSARAPLPGRGRFACIQLFTAQFDDKGQPLPIQHVALPTFKSFDSSALVQEARRSGYFETRWMSWDSSLVRPLNALFLVLLREGTRNTPLGRLGGGYRLWHRLLNEKPDGYSWKISQDTENDKHYEVEIILSGSLNRAVRVSCPKETVKVTFEYEWL